MFTGCAHTDTPPRFVTVTNLGTPDTFVEELDALGIDYRDRAAVIEMGHTVCRLLRQQVTPQDVVLAIQAHSNVNLQTAVRFTLLSVQHICPDAQQYTDAH